MNKIFIKNTQNCLVFSGVMALGLGCSDTLSEKGLEAEVNTSKVSSETIVYRTALENRILAEKSIGLAVAIIDDNKQDILTLGLANAAKGQKIDTESLFEIGSITKTFTAIILADMVIKGEVRLDDPASNYLPLSVIMPEFEGQKITLKNLATHTSALPRMPSNFNPADPSNPFVDYTPELLYSFLSEHTLGGPIGKEVAYSNLGMGLLGHILELHSGKSYEQLVTERILEPLAMTDSFITIPPHKISNFVIGHTPSGEPTSHWDITTLSGAGALRSDISDMTKYLKANMGLTDTPLSAALEMSHKFQHKSGNDGSYIGLAWFTQDMNGKSVTWHNGGTGGFRTFLGFDTKNKRGAIVLSNSHDQADLIGQSILTRKPEMLEPDVKAASLKFTTEELERFVGNYKLAPEFIISITRNGDSLFLQATGQPKFPIFAKSKTEFFLKVVDASLIFEANDQGEITKFILDQGGVRQAASKL